MFLKTLWFGSFLINDNQVVDYTLFPQEATEIASRYLRIQNGEILQEEETLTEGLSDVKVSEGRLLKLGNTILSKDNDAQAMEDISLEPEDYKFSQDVLREALVHVYSKKLDRVLKDREIIELITTLDDLNRTINLLRERDHEWGKVYRNGPNPRIIEEFRDRIQQMQDYREDLTLEIERMMGEQNPSLSTLTGELLGARLIALAGGRERLARLPSGTVQILGAETAFFRFRKTGTGMPKHGIIYQHPLIKNARRGFRGKIARSLAAKIAIASRIDFYSGRDEGDSLKKAVEERANLLSGKS